jgi:hypothetical protein
MVGEEGEFTVVFTADKSGRPALRSLRGTGDKIAGGTGTLSPRQ